MELNIGNLMDETMCSGKLYI